MPDSKVVFCDTGFVIRLLDRTNELHPNAVDYFRNYLNEGYMFRMSTIAIAEYCVRGQMSELPLKEILPTPFNVYHAQETGKCADILFKEKAKGVRVANARILIQNDVKMFVQAQIEGAKCYLTADSESKTMYDILRNARKLSFEFIDIHVPYNERFGLLDM